MQEIELSDEELEKLLARDEGHFLDFKSIEIKPAKLTRSISAFANADGGELFVGISQSSHGGRKAWLGFDTPEDANGLIQAIEEILPLGNYNRISFLKHVTQNGLICHVEIFKTRQILYTASHHIFVRRGAQNIPIQNDEQKKRLELDKGIHSFETETVNIPREVITNSANVIEFMLEIVPQAEPELWLKKQMLIAENKPTVAGIVLFSDDPQAALPKRCGIKLYRYKTTGDEGTR